MKKTLITSICLLFFVAAYAQENNERYEYAAFRINHGFSEGAVTTDFVMKAGLMSDNMIMASRDAFFQKDIIFDVEFLPNGDEEIIRVYHLEEVLPQDLKIIFVAATGTEEFTVAPSRFYKMDATTRD